MKVLPDALDTYFSEFVTIDVPGLAKLLPIDRKTIKRHINSGRLPYRIKGLGRVKVRRVFTKADVEAFLDADHATAPNNPTLGIRRRPARPRKGSSAS